MAARFRMTFLLIAISLPAATSAFATGFSESVVSPKALVELEHRANTADLRDQCVLYTELAYDLIEVAGQQMKNGDEDAVASTLTHLDRVTTKIHAAAVADARRLQNAEMLLEHTTHRLSDMMHLASTEQRASMKTTLDHLNQVHTEMLAVVFAK